MKFLLATIILLYSFLSYSSEKAYFRPLERKSVELVEGDSFKGVIELWGITNIAPQMIQELVGTTYLDSFYIVELEKPRWSENNPDLIVIEGTFVLQNKITEKSKKWKLGGVTVDVEIREIDTVAFLDKKKGYVVLEGEYKLTESKIYLILAVAFVLALLAFVLILSYVSKKRKALREVGKEKINWKRYFTKASSREDFSMLYSQKHEWTKELGGREQLYGDFLKASEMYLFKKNLEEFELEELKLSVEPIARELD